MPKLIATLSVAAIFCASCSNSPDEPSESLVGASKLPTEEALLRETLYITRGANAWGGDRLSYELRPDGSLTVTHTYLDDQEPDSTVRGKNTIKLSSDVAAKVRQLLWRVRPNKLHDLVLDKETVRPVGCERRGPHDFGEVGVAFINEGDTIHTADDQLAIFELPWPTSCNTSAAIKARAAIREAIQLLPESEVVAGFERVT